ncbi:von Willebrand factor D and EGF domain-containing protein-like isoform X7 [Oculina patagonica]
MYVGSLLFFKLSMLFMLEKSRGQLDCSGCCGEGNHTVIEEPRRSIKSIWEVGQVALCDRALAWGWYRFKSFVGEQMPTSIVSPNRCGTVSPVWIQGTHPSEQEGTVTRKACVNFFNISKGCADSFNIQVRNCTTFYVYFLRPTYSCAIAYCAGTKEPCPYGKIGEPDECHDPPTAFDRSFLGEPTITYEPLDKGSRSVALRCDVPFLNPSIQHWTNISYRIVWYSEGKHLYTDDLCGPLRSDEGTEYEDPCQGRNRPLFSRLDGSKYRVNRWISCNVTARYTSSPLNPWCHPQNIRKPFFAGLKVEPTTIQITECSQNITSFTITPTIPVGKRSQDDHYLNISFWLPKGILLVNQSKCAVEIKDMIPVTVRIIATCKNYPTDETGVDRVIIPRMEGGHSRFWNRDMHLPAIWVSVVENTENVQSCSTFTDPHYTTFGGIFDYTDSRNIYLNPIKFAFMGHGDFILYRNAERNFEIHTRLWACSHRTVTCNCGVVLRDHNDVIEFNSCNEKLYYDHTTPMRLKIRSKKRLAPGIFIKQTIPGFNSQYQVLFPSGVKVEIYRNWYGLNVIFQTPRAQHFGNESGLCLYNNESDIQKFGDTLRFEPGDSYFDRLPDPVNDIAVEYDPPCSCHRRDVNGEPECVTELPVHYPSVLDSEGNVIIDTRGTGRKRRDIHYSDDLTDEDFELFKHYVEPVVSHRYKRELLNKPTFTKENATLYCIERVLNTDAGKECAKLGANVQAMVNACAIDLELTGETSFAISAISLLINECGGIIGKNLSSNVNEGVGEKPANSSVLMDIVKLLCPNDCTFNGRCVNGSCICNKGYTANDCAISTKQIPSISMLQGNGVCDRRQRPCRKVTVMGNGFLNSTNITCHVKEFKVVNGSWRPNYTDLLFPGFMTDLVLVDCYLPESPVVHSYFDDFVEGTPAAGLIISVSNDGEHRSKENLTFISYDSGCLTCNASSGCFLKSNSCIINRYCFASNEVNPNDWCYQCLPEINKNTWTKRQGNLPPQFALTTNYYAIFQENLELTIDVSDQEGMPVTVSLMNGGQSEAAMRDNVLVWTATNDTTTMFSLKATDACQAFSTLNITISLVICPCQNNGSCVAHPNKPRGSGYYECNCVPGFTGDQCETNIDECQSYPCLRGDCTDEINGFTCNCYRGYVGHKCDINYDDCSSSPCIHGNCTDYVGAYRCTCERGYTGKNCTVNIDDCQSSPCKNGTCLDRINNFTCNCQTGFTGMKCEENIDDCLPVPCGNGTCTDLVNNYTCNCYAGFTGPNCDIFIQTCSKGSCFPNVTCFENGQRITCGPCPFGFTGDGKICEDVDDCVNHKCRNGGSCEDGVNSYSCTCMMGFTGDHCETDIDDCVNHTCSNGGSCEDGVNSYNCNCIVGFTGDHCETDIDDCVNHTCSNGGSCEDSVNSYLCNCLVGFTGVYCETDIDDCVNHTCSNAGTCVDGVNTYSCNCLAGFTGDYCETDIDDCVNHTCSNGGSCVDGVNSYSCNCIVGFTGNYCETDIDYCVNHTCYNGGSCVDGISSYSCNCPAGYTGAYCENGLASSSVSTQETTTKSTMYVKASTSTTIIATITDQLLITPVTASSSSQQISITPSLKEPPTSSSAVGDIPTTSKKDKTATAQPTTEQPETELVVQLRIQRTWNKDLENKNSQAYKELSSIIEIQITKQYSNDDNFIGVKILSFRPGSVVAEFQLMFKNKLEDEEALAPLKKAAEDGEMGPLSVDPGSLKIIKEDEDPTKEGKQKIPYPVIIGVSCGGVFVLALISICLIRYCHQRKVVTQRRVSDGMPSEMAFPKPEKYELQETGSKEDIVRYEEIAMWNESARYEELGILQDSARYEKLGFSNATYQEAGIPNAAGDYQEIGIPNAAGDYQEIGISSDSLR